MITSGVEERQRGFQVQGWRTQNRELQGIIAGCAALRTYRASDQNLMLGTQLWGVAIGREAGLQESPRKARWPPDAEKFLVCPGLYLRCKTARVRLPISASSPSRASPAKLSRANSENGVASVYRVLASV